jgi:hypothetical protein
MTELKKLVEDASLASRAIIFKLSRGGTRRRVRDAAAEQLVKQQLGDEGQIVSRELFRDKTSPVHQYQALSSEMYQYHIRATLPFGRDGGGLLPNERYFDYTTAMTNFISRLDNLRDTIVANWTSIVSNDIALRNHDLAQQGKAQTASATDYPDVSEIQDKLYVNWHPSPVPTAGNFLVELPPSMQQRFEQYEKDVITACNGELIDRMLTPLNAFINKLSKYTGEKGQRWHDSFVENLASVVDALPVLNINKNPEIDAMHKQLKELVTPLAASSEALKEDKAVRDEVKARMEELARSMSGYKF